MSSTPGLRSARSSWRSGRAARPILRIVSQRGCAIRFSPDRAARLLRMLKEGPVCNALRPRGVRLQSGGVLEGVWKGRRQRPFSVRERGLLDGPGIRRSDCQTSSGGRCRSSGGRCRASDERCRSSGFRCFGSGRRGTGLDRRCRGGRTHAEAAAAAGMPAPGAAKVGPDAGSAAVAAGSAAVSAGSTAVSAGSAGLPLARQQ